MASNKFNNDNSNNDDENNNNKSDNLGENCKTWSFSPTLQKQNV